MGMWHSRPPPLHGKCHLKFPFWLFEPLPNLKHVLTSVSLFTRCKILWLILGLCLCPFYVSSWSSFPQEGGHRPGHLPSKPRGSEVSNPSQVYHESHMANFPIWQHRLRSKTLSKSRGKPRTAASWLLHHLERQVFLLMDLQWILKVLNSKSLPQLYLHSWQNNLNDAVVITCILLEIMTFNQ